MSKFQNYLYDPEDPLTPAKVQSEIPEFNFECEDIKKLIKYTIYVYDPKADLLKLFPTDFNRRKREAALKAGFKIGKDGKFPEWIENCIVGDNEKCNDAIVAFVLKFDSADLPSFVLYREIFYSEFRAAMSVKDSKEKKEVMINIETSRKQLQLLEKKLFTDEESVNLRNALYLAADRLKLDLRPEEMAKRIADKSLDLPNPYNFLK